MTFNAKVKIMRELAQVRDYGRVLTSGSGQCFAASAAFFCVQCRLRYRKLRLQSALEAGLAYERERPTTDQCDVCTLFSLFYKDLDRHVRRPFPFPHLIP